MKVNIGLKEIMLYGLKILAGAILMLLFPAFSLLFFYGLNQFFYHLIPQWVDPLEFTPESLTDNYIGGLMVLATGLTIITLTQIWNEYTSRDTHEEVTP